MERPRSRRLRRVRALAVDRSPDLIPSWHSDATNPWETPAIASARNLVPIIGSEGLPAPRVLPYLAELAFARRDFDEVMRLLGELRAYPDQPRLQPLLRLWRLA